MFCFDWIMDKSLFQRFAKKIFLIILVMLTIYLLLSCCMQLDTLKISNLLSYPYHEDLSIIEGTKFFNRKNNNVNTLIGPNGAGKSWFLHIIHQIFTVGLMRDYTYEKWYITDKNIKKYTNVIHYNKQFTQWLNAHFSTYDKDSQVLLRVLLTEHDINNMKYISQHRTLLNMLIKKYSTLTTEYYDFSCDDIDTIPSSLELLCTFDHKKNTISIDEKKLSPEEKFALLCMQTLELVQICIDIYNEFERWNEEPLVPVQNGVAFISNNRSLQHIPHAINPHAWNELIADKNSAYHHSYLWFFLCVKKIWNIISKNWSLKMTKKKLLIIQKDYKNPNFLWIFLLVLKNILIRRLR